MDPSEFDAELADLQSQVEAVVDVLAKYPDVAAEVAAALANPQRQELTADEQARRARLNALTQTVARLADVV